MVLDFWVWDAQSASDYAAWEAHWTRWSAREIFAHPAYSLQYQGEGVRCLAAAMSTDEGNVLYAFQLRDLTEEIYCPREMGRIYDITTPYGYGGPFYWDSGNPDRLAELFWPRFNTWAKDKQVVAEVIRFHLFPDCLLPYPGQTEQVFQNVVCGLERSQEDIWIGFEHKVRKNVKKAERSGVTVVTDYTGEHLEDFLRIYHATMARREAGDAFYFPREFFEQFHARLPNQSAYFHSLHQGRVISSELVLCSAENVYSFLGGTEEAEFALRPNDLLKFEIIRWGKQQGKKHFVLGGGYGGEDGIYRYKRSFAPEGEVPFCIGKRIFDQNLYDRLLECRAEASRVNGDNWVPRAKYFPIYRA